MKHIHNFPPCERWTTSSLSVFSVRQAKRSRHANDHAGYLRCETGRAATLVSRVSRLRRSTLARACTPLTKYEQKERLLAVYVKERNS